MHLLTDVKPELVWQATDEDIEAGHVGAMIVLECFLNLEVELIVDLVFHLEIIQLEKLLLQGSLGAIIVCDQSTKGTGNQVKR